MYSYLKNRADEYYVILPYLYRISEDYNPSTGAFYKPPNKLDRYNGVDATLVKLYTQQAQSLYTEINMRTPKELMAKIKSTFKYGLHEQLTGRCAEHDGPMAYFSLLSLYRPSSAAYRDKLIETFNQAYTQFAKGDPKAKIQQLRRSLVEAIKLQIPLTWSTTGKKIVGVLSRRDHILSNAIRKYEAGPDRPDPRRTQPSTCKNCSHQSRSNVTTSPDWAIECFRTPLGTLTQHWEQAAYSSNRTRYLPSTRSADMARDATTRDANSSTLTIVSLKSAKESLSKSNGHLMASN